MEALVIPPIKTPIAHPRKQPIVLPPQLDPSCVLCLLPLRDNKWYDYSGYGNHGVLEGTVWSAEGRHGPCLGFDKIDDYINCGHDSSLDIVDAITLEAWIYPTSYGENNYGYVISKELSGYVMFIADTATYRKTLVLYASNGAINQQSNTDVIALNRWQHVVITYDRVVVRFYIDGVFDRFKWEGDPLGINASDLRIANRASLNRSFGGLIDEVRIYNRVLSADDIGQLYEQGREVRS